MKRKSGSKPRLKDIASLLLLFLNGLGLVLVSELISVDEMVRYDLDGAITSFQFKIQALLLLAVVTANLAACVICVVCAYSDGPGNAEGTNL